ncbi:hypothetical protein ACWWJF_04290 [Symbiopectobacterium sp. Eva_TO]
MAKQTFKITNWSVYNDALRQRGSLTVWFLKLLQLLGLAERKSRPSSKHPDKEKLFLSLTEKGLQFGKNLTDPANPRQTQPHFYDSLFPRLLGVMMNGIAA